MYYFILILYITAISILKGRSDHPHFIEEKSEAQRDHVTNPKTYAHFSGPPHPPYYHVSRAFHCVLHSQGKVNQDAQLPSGKDTPT